MIAPALEALAHDRVYTTHANDKESALSLFHETFVNVPGIEHQVLVLRSMGDRFRFSYAIVPGYVAGPITPDDKGEVQIPVQSFSTDLDRERVRFALRKDGFKGNIAFWYKK
jgi:hypothetical protein